LIKDKNKYDEEILAGTDVVGRSERELLKEVTPDLSIEQRLQGRSRGMIPGRWRRTASFMSLSSLLFCSGTFGHIAGNIGNIAEEGTFLVYRSRE
jgi:hypothetical protein